MKIPHHTDDSLLIYVQSFMFNNNIVCARFEHITLSDANFYVFVVLGEREKYRDVPESSGILFVQNFIKFSKYWSLLLNQD